MKKAIEGDVVGVDVAKDRLDVRFHRSGDAFRVVNDEKGVAILVAILLLRRAGRVVYESTGNLGYRLRAMCEQEAVAVHCVPPQRIRDFARALGKMAKTDRIDAEVIALFGVTATFRPPAVRSEAVEKLHVLLVRRSQLVEMETMERNHRWSSLVPVADDLLKALRKSIAAIDKSLAAVVAADDELLKRATALQTIKGVGPVMTYAFLSLMPELGACTSKEAASLVGVAPFNDDSGKRSGHRAIRGGRRRIRNILYMATRTSVRFEPVLISLYTRLRAAGKPDKVAIVAAMRKLVVIANARVRDALIAPATPALAA